MKDNKLIFQPDTERLINNMTRYKRQTTCREIENGDCADLEADKARYILMHIIANHFEMQSISS